MLVFEVYPFLSVYIYLYMIAVTIAVPLLAYTVPTVRTANWGSVQRLLLQKVAAEMPHQEQRGSVLLRELSRAGSSVETLPRRLERRVQKTVRRVSCAHEEEGTSLT